MKIVKYGAKWCKACSVLEPKLMRFADEYKIEVELVDVDEETDRAVAANVTTLPTTHFVSDEGTVLYVILGVVEQADLTSIWTELLVQHGDV